MAYLIVAIFTGEIVAFNAHVLKKQIEDCITKFEHKPVHVSGYRLFDL